MSAQKSDSPLVPSVKPPPPPSNGAPNSKSVSFGRISAHADRSNDDTLNEQSPLLPARSSADGNSNLRVVSPLGSDEDWQDGRKEETKSSWYLLLLTLSGLGLQMSWSVEMAYGSPYLLSLGISKSLLALVWIAAPLSGIIIQPYIGAVSDRCRSQFGKRRPFIVGGAAATIVALMLLAWTKDWVAGLLALFGADPASQGVGTCVIMVAVLLIYVLDFAINTMQAGIRAFVTDCAPTHQQEDANAWIARTTGAGNIIGYLAGFVKLPKYLPFLGYLQFQVLCAITCIFLACSVSVSCASISERDPRLDGTPNADESVVAFMKSLIQSVFRLPTQIKRVCQVQLAAWVAWFPFLFYTTTYIGEVYADPYFRENPNMTDEEIDAIMEKATRVGSLALFVFALTTFTASVFLPFIVAPTFKPPQPTTATPLTPATPTSPIASRTGADYFAPKHTCAHHNHTLSSRLALYLSYLRIPSLSLRRAWLLSHLLFSVCMFLTFFVRTIPAATALIALVGIPWSLTQWAPFALISAEVSKRDAIRRGLIRPPPTRNAALLAAGEDESVDQAGVVLGIHNVAVAAPQVLATLVSSVIFRMLQKPRGSPGDDSVGWVLRFGGICALGAAWLTRRVGDGNEDLREEGE